MAKKKRIPMEKIEKIAKVLKQLPVKDTSKSLREAVAFLAKEITETLEKGYTLKDISEIWQKEDEKVSPATLKTYLSGSDKKIAKKRRKKDTHATSGEAGHAA